MIRLSINYFTPPHYVGKLYITDPLSNKVLYGRQIFLKYVFRVRFLIRAYGKNMLRKMSFF